jgi:hypothetical protein
VSTLSTTNLKHPSSGSNNIVLDSSGNTRVTAITDSAGANSSTPEAIANGTAKAWVNFDGTGTVAIRAAYNVSSITDNGTGDYTVNFTTALVDANYSVVCTGEQNPNGSSQEVRAFHVNAQSVPTTTGARLMNKRTVAGGTTSDIDGERLFVAIFR